MTLIELVPLAVAAISLAQQKGKPSPAWAAEALEAYAAVGRTGAPPSPGIVAELEASFRGATSALDALIGDD